MFQYAFGLALATHKGVKLLLDTRGFAHYKLRIFGLDRFAISARIATPQELKHWPNWLRYPCRIARQLGISTRWYAERSLKYDPQWLGLGDNILVEGYFQSERYFNSITDRLRSEFVPKDSFSLANSLFLERARDPGSIAVHVRRGDYVSDKQAQKVHGVCSVEYYRNAISIIKSKVATPHFFVFSDDVDWARGNLDVGSDATFVVGNQDSPEVDIFLMSQCANHIIANSSFSWWGAWLAANLDKIVIAPAPWFDDQQLSSEGLIPPSWITIHK